MGRSMLNMFFLSFLIMILNVVINVTNPLVLAAILVITSLMVGFLVIQMFSSWFFYVLVLVFLGGVMVLVVYMCTLCSNEKFSAHYYSWGFTFALMVTVINMLPFLPAGFSLVGSGGVVHLYEYGEVVVLVYLMGFLMATLICVVKLVKFEAGPLVKRL